MPEQNAGWHARGVAVHLLLNCRDYVLTMVIVMLCLTATAQNMPSRQGSRIIDDTTKQIYGPNTSRYFYETEVFYKREILHPIDTLIKNFQRWNYVQRYNNLYQDLGNIG